MSEVPWRRERTRTWWPEDQGVSFQGRKLLTLAHGRWGVERKKSWRVQEWRVVQYCWSPRCKEGVKWDELRNIIWSQARSKLKNWARDLRIHPVFQAEVFKVILNIKVKVFIYLLKGRKIKVSQLPIYSPNACSNWGLARLKLEARNSMQVSHMTGRDPTAWFISCCLPRHMLARSWTQTQARQLECWCPKTH